MFTLEDLIKYVELNNLGDKPFNEVMALYEKDIEEFISSSEADAYLATMEAHELT